ncbi:hypothetical protein OFDDKENP_00154 [Aeromonas phage B614]|nr:hypothetical protein OFDDKENP_00154 [Aeromonas phage B614]UYD58118.1 hypothetical protein JNEOFJEA_00021 [Aeromonas phage UP87]UYD58482.1 hypothetical protein IPAKJDPM_00139 [Aeromonas phage avDM14-QBC]UYD58698.1 hypothetical protein HNNIDBEH_00105 [Aeromonas phage avDM10-HWA]UYD58999.1 hypothetical protein OFOPOMKI_00149 [Aeromonas phage avDM7-IJDJ]UYD59811.1 hypothetical protein LEHPIFIF_00038 [Aeromonas phage avDM9-HANS]
MCKPNYRLLLAEEKSHGVEKELYDLFIEMNSIGANNQDTWGKLFKTKAYNEAQAQIAEYKEKIRKIIVANFPKCTEYKYELIGLRGIVDVSMKRGQRILVQLTYGENA